MILEKENRGLMSELELLRTQGLGTSKFDGTLSSRVQDIKSALLKQSDSSDTKRSTSMFLEGLSEAVFKVH